MEKKPRWKICIIRRNFKFLTKLKGKLLLDFQIRNIRSFAQLKRELEMNYLEKRGMSHLEFNALKPRKTRTPSDDT